MKILLTVFIGLIGISASAANLKLLDVTSSANKDHAALGIRTTPQNAITHVLFQAQGHRLEAYAVADLASYKTLVKVKTDLKDFDALKVKAFDEDGDLHVVLDYLHSAINPFHSRDKKEITVRFNKHINRYEVVDDDSERVITRAHVVQSSVGIDEIQTN